MRLRDPYFPPPSPLAIQSSVFTLEQIRIHCSNFSPPFPNSLLATRTQHVQLRNNYLNAKRIICLLYTAYYLLLTYSSVFRITDRSD